MNLALHQATTADLPLLIQLYAEMDGHAPLSIEQGGELFTQIQQVPNYRIYLAYGKNSDNDDSPIGTFSLIDVPTFMHSGYHKYAVIDAVSIRPHLRGQGLGTTMMQQAIQLCADRGCYKVQLSSNRHRTQAHDFYKSLGFQQHGWSFLLTLHPSHIHSTPPEKAHNLKSKI
ncbi:MAG: GNAT family N-acetyltransferase [Cyanobacteria bacterium P01_G01_bin.38]